MQTRLRASSLRSAIAPRGASLLLLGAALSCTEGPAPTTDQTGSGGSVTIGSGGNGQPQGSGGAAVGSGGAGPNGTGGAGTGGALTSSGGTGSGSGGAP